MFSVFFTYEVASYQSDSSVMYFSASPASRRRCDFVASSPAWARACVYFSPMLCFVAPGYLALYLLRLVSCYGGDASPRSPIS